MIKDQSNMTRIVELLLDLGDSEVIRQSDGIMTVVKVATGDTGRRGEIFANALSIVRIKMDMPPDQQRWIENLISGCFAFIQLRSIQRTGQDFSQLILDAEMREAARSYDSRNDR